MKNIAKTIEKIEKAKYVTDNLLDKTSDFVEYVETKMIENGVAKLLGGKYVLITMRSSVGDDTSLYLNVSDYYSDKHYVMIGCARIDSTRDTHYMYGQFDLAYNLPCRDDILTLISDASDILAELAALSDSVDTSAIDSVVAQ